MSKNFNLEAFQSDVLERIKNIQKLDEPEAVPFYREVPSTQTLRAKNPGCLGLVSIGLLKFAEFSALWTSWRIESYITKLTEKATKIAEQDEIKSQICPSLQAVDNNPYAIARIIIPILVPLAKARFILLPVESDLFAMLALIIAKRGVADYCNASPVS